MSFTIIEKLTSVLLRSPLTKEVTHKTQNSVSRKRKPQKTKTYVKKNLLKKNSVRHSAEEPLCCFR